MLPSTFNNHEVIDSIKVEECPFEWLTSASSLRPFLLRALALDAPSFSGTERTRNVLDIGCGSSGMGTRLVQDPIYGVKLVLNVDKDKETLERVENRWKKQLSQQPSSDSENRQQFQCVDFSKQEINAPNGSFDIVIDKSTLDYTLCSDRSTTCLLMEVYRLLRPSTGVYLLVSFHHKDFLLPLLQRIPGVDWIVEHFIMKREVREDVYDGIDRIDQTIDMASLPSCSNRIEDDPSEQERRTWSASGHFQPDENYQNTVNVFLCRKQNVNDSLLDPEAVYCHVQAICDDWYNSHSPMSTIARKESLEKAFVGSFLKLKQAYDVLFTTEERDYYSVENFMKDWTAFLANHSNLPKDSMSFETAFLFLNEMQ